MLKTRQIVNIGLISALAFVLSMFVLFRMPQGGSITLYLIPLFFIFFNDNLKTCFFVALVTATLQTLLGGYVIHPIQVILDYYLPVMFITTCMIFRMNKYVNLSIGATLAMACYVISGMVFFEAPFEASFIYNATFFVPTLILNIIVFLILNPRLSKIYQGNN
jgi:thiamine transporter